MPQLPKWLADTMVVVVSPWLHHAMVEHTVMLSDTLKLITFKGDFESEHFLPGEVVQFRVDDKSFRHYTLSSFNKEEGSCTVLFYLNGKGPGSHWAAHLQAGHQVSFRAGKGKLQYNGQASHHFFFGDETSIGLFDWYKTMALANSHEYFGVLELKPQPENGSWGHEPGKDVLGALKIMIDSVDAYQEAPAVNAIAWMEDMHPDCWTTWKRATFYLAGRALSISRFRKYLLQRNVAGKQILTTAYWADGKKGL